MHWTGWAGNLDNVQATDVLTHPSHYDHPAAVYPSCRGRGDTPLPPSAQARVIKRLRQLEDHQTVTTHR